MGNGCCKYQIQSLAMVDVLELASDSCGKPRAKLADVCASISIGIDARIENLVDNKRCIR